MSQITTKHKRSFQLLLLTLLIVCLPSLLFGSIMRSDTVDVKISNLHIIDDDMYIFGRHLVDIDGEILGEFSCFAYKPTIRGTITSSANLFGETISHRGIINGSLRAFAQSIEIDGSIDRSALLFGNEISIKQGSVIGRDLHVAGNIVSVDGSIGGNLIIRGNKVTIAGQIDGDVDIKAEEIIVLASTTVNGNLIYTLESGDDLILAPGSDIHGEVIKREVVDSAEESTTAAVIMQISSMLAAFLFGLVVVRLFKPYATESFTQLKAHTVASFATGIFGFAGLLISIIVLALAAIFLLAGVTLVSTGSTPLLGIILVIFSTLALPLSAFASVTGWIIFYSGKVVVALLIGYLIIGLLTKESKLFSAWSLLLGLVVLLLLSNIPYLGTPIYLIYMITGGGAILIGIRKCRQARTTDSQATESLIDNS